MSDSESFRRAGGRVLAAKGGTGLPKGRSFLIGDKKLPNLGIWHLAGRGEPESQVSPPEGP